MMLISSSDFQSCDRKKLKLREYFESKKRLLKNWNQVNVLPHQQETISSGKKKKK
jgi:hypothetical protein